MQPKSYDIAISSQREFYVNGNKIEKDALEQKFLEITKNDTVTIRADKLTPYEEFVFIIDVLKQKGIEKIGMVVQDE
jgi:biopolymer transport protein ExbD